MGKVDKELIKAKQDLFRSLRGNIRSESVLRAMEQVPRELFVPPENRHMAYQDLPLSIGEGQTISQPYIVALMTAGLQLGGGERVLEIGTGSGYQAAVLSLLVPPRAGSHRGANTRPGLFGQDPTPETGVS